MSMRPSAEEFSVWSRPDLITRLLEDGEWLVHRLSHRFDEAAKAPNLDHGQLRQAFTPFIVQRNDYPPVLQRAAVEAWLYLDEADLEPLNDGWWQGDRDATER